MKSNEGQMKMRNVDRRQLYEEQNEQYIVVPYCPGLDLKLIVAPLSDSAQYNDNLFEVHWSIYL